MTELVTVALAVLAGALVAPIAVAAVVRWPDGRPVTAGPPDACPACQGLLPRVSAPRRARMRLSPPCPHCGAAVERRRPVVGVAVVGLSAAVAAVEGPTWLLPALLVTSWALVVATAIDLRHRIIPNRMTYPLPGVLLLLLLPPSFLGPGSSADLVRGVVAALVVSGLFLAAAELYRLLRGRMGFGMGDVKLLVSLGLVCGYLGALEVALLLYGAVLAAVVAAVALLASGRASLMSRIPFGPYLAVGTLLAILAGDALEPVLLGWLGLS